ncbi:MAG: hypothetical protein LBI14_01960 [Treponema sp.]|jgi:hypothetical protein|nr:hypothetical protein [Treponema sp.]
MTSLMNLKTVVDGFEVEYEIIPPLDTSFENDPKKLAIIKAKNQIETRLQINSDKIEELNKEIDRLTNHADGIDYMVAVGSGIIAGIVDSLWVGEFSFKRGKDWSNKTVNDFVMKTAKKQGYNGNRLDGAIQHLENKFKIPSDNIWKGGNTGISAKSHHIDDLAHHPSPIGLFFSILTQFTKKGYFQNSSGTFLPISIDENGEGLIGHDFISKIFAGTINWFYHLVSDMSGSKKTAGVGMGIPGPIVSLLKELSMMPGLKNSGLPKKINDAFVKNKFDLRSEMAVGHELGRQAVPVILNEVIVRAFYFIRRLVREIKEKGNFKEIEWKNCLPWNNRTIVRMLTIATGTFTACDLIDAAIRGALKSGGNPALFAKEFILRVNFVGVGRFAIAVYSDVKMGIQRSKLRNKRIAIYSEQLHLSNAKIFYLQADMWIAAKETEQTINEVFDMMDKTIVFYIESLKAIEADIDDIERSKKLIERKDKKFINEIEETLKWG